MRVTFAKFPLLSKIWTLSHKLLVRQTSNHHHCDWYGQKFIGWDFQLILSSSSWSKTTLCIFKEQIWFPNRKCYGKNKLCFDSLSQQRKALSPSFSLNTLYRWLTVGDSTLCAGFTNSLSIDSKTYLVLTSGHNDADAADNADATDDAHNTNNYNRVIGIT